MGAYSSWVYHLRELYSCGIEVVVESLWIVNNNGEKQVELVFSEGVSMAEKDQNDGKEMDSGFSNHPELRL